jgi:hypothetical protein
MNINTSTKVPTSGPISTFWMFEVIELLHVIQFSWSDNVSAKSRAVSLGNEVLAPILPPVPTESRPTHDSMVDSPQKVPVRHSACTHTTINCYFVIVVPP